MVLTELVQLHIVVNILEAKVLAEVFALLDQTPIFLDPSVRKSNWFALMTVITLNTYPVFDLSNKNAKLFSIS